MSDDVIIPAEIAQQVANILRQNPDPAIQQLADIVTPPPTAPVPSIFESITDVITVSNNTNSTPSNTAIQVLSLVSDRVYEILSESVPAYFCSQISDIIKNG